MKWYWRIIWWTHHFPLHCWNHQWLEASISSFSIWKKKMGLVHVGKMCCWRKPGALGNDRIYCYNMSGRFNSLSPWDAGEESALSTLSLRSCPVRISPNDGFWGVPLHFFQYKSSLAGIWRCYPSKKVLIGLVRVEMIFQKIKTILQSKCNGQ